MTAFERFERIPRQKYRVLYCDPPWTFRTYSDAGKGRSPEQHYECLSLADIQALPVAELAHPEGCALLMWITDPCLEQGLATMKAWGFEYKTVAFTWVKRNMKAEPRNRGTLLTRNTAAPLWSDDQFFTGMGYYTRANPEMCLLGRRGVLKRQHKDVRQLVISPRREHSRKPDEVPGRIERLFPGPYIELFGRTEREGWDVWGNQTSLFAG